MMKRMTLPAMLLASLAAAPAWAQTDPAQTTSPAPGDPAATATPAPAYPDPAQAASDPAQAAAPAPTYSEPAPAPAYSEASTSGSFDGDYDFTGLRVEFLGGYQRILPDRNTVGPVFSTSRTPRHSGISAGIQGGYDIQLGPVVVGAFGTFSLITSNGCGPLGGLNKGCLRPVHQAEGGGRVGFVLTPRAMIYAKGAYVNTRINTTNRDGNITRNSHINKDGWRVGGGAEYAINPKVYVKAEYNYGRTERFSAAPYGFDATRLDYHTHSGLVGFGIRF